MVEYLHHTLEVPSDGLASYLGYENRVDIINKQRFSRGSRPCVWQKSLKAIFFLFQSNSEALTTKLSTRTQEINTVRLENEQLKVEPVRMFKVSKILLLA